MVRHADGRDQIRTHESSATEEVLPQHYLYVIGVFSNCRNNRCLTHDPSQIWHDISTLLQLPDINDNTWKLVEEAGRTYILLISASRSRKLTAAMISFSEMEMGIYSRSSSSWASLLHMVSKSDGR